MSCENEECSCSSDTSTNEVKISLDGQTEEVISLVNSVAKVAVDYPLAISGVKKRATEARKSLMEIKKLALDMRKSAIEKCKKAKENE